MKKDDERLFKFSILSVKAWNGSTFHSLIKHISSNKVLLGWKKYFKKRLYHFKKKGLW